MASPYLPYYTNFSSSADFSAAVMSVPLADNSFDAFSTQRLFYGATAATSYGVAHVVKGDRPRHAGTPQNDHRYKVVPLF
jgi:hypothetical protein